MIKVSQLILINGHFIRAALTVAVETENELKLNMPYTIKETMRQWY